MRITFDYLAREKKAVMEEWKRLMRSIEEGKIDQGRIYGVMLKIERIDQMILNEAHEQAKTCIHYNRKPEYDYRYLISPEFWDK